MAGGRWLVGRLVSGWQQVAGGRCLEEEVGGWRQVAAGGVQVEEACVRFASEHVTD